MKVDTKSDVRKGLSQDTCFNRTLQLQSSKTRRFVLKSESNALSRARSGAGRGFLLQYENIPNGIAENFLILLSLVLPKSYFFESWCILIRIFTLLWCYWVLMCATEVLYKCRDTTQHTCSSCRNMWYTPADTPLLSFESRTLSVDDTINEIRLSWNSMVYKINFPQEWLLLHISPLWKKKLNQTHHSTEDISLDL